MRPMLTVLRCRILLVILCILVNSLSLMSLLPYLLLSLLICSDIFFVVLADLTKAMLTPILGERPTSADLDLARVGLDAPLKAPLPAGTGPSTRMPPGCRG